MLAPTMLRGGLSNRTLQYAGVSSMMRRCGADSVMVPTPCGRPDVTVAETVDQVIVDHADRLHVRVDHCRSDEAEAAALEIAAECVRVSGRCGNLAQRAPAILPRPAIDKLPAIRVEASKFFLHDGSRSEGGRLGVGGQERRRVSRERVRILK